MRSNMSTMKKMAVLGLAASAVASPIDVAARSENAAAVAYQAYRGDGSAAAGWPGKDQWISLDEMWARNRQVIVNNNVGHEGEVDLVKQAVIEAAGNTGIDARFILAILLQESNGQIRVGTTSYGNSGDNPGLMQSHGGPSCANKDVCPYADILGMVMQGVQYGSNGINLKDLIAKSGKPEPQSFFWAARYYNSGPNSMTPECHDNLSCVLSKATVTYTSDIANRLRGLTDQTGARGAVRNPDLFKNEAC